MFKLLIMRAYFSQIDQLISKMFDTKLLVHVYVQLLTMQLIIYNLLVEDSNWSPKFGEAEAKKVMHPKMVRNKRVLRSG